MSNESRRTLVGLGLRAGVERMIERLERMFNSMAGRRVVRGLLQGGPNQASQD